MSVRIVVEVPERAFFALADAAELADMSVAEFVLSAGMRTAMVRGAAPDGVQRLHALGLSDSEIGRRLNMTNRAVSAQRRRLQLPPNRLIRGSHQERKSA